MSPSSIQQFGFRPQDLAIEPDKTQQPDNQPGSGPSFGDALKDALYDTEQTMATADASATSYIAGEGGDLHNVLIEMQRADLKFKTMLQVRNKLLEAYKEIMRMPV